MALIIVIALVAPATHENKKGAGISLRAIDGARHSGPFCDCDDRIRSDALHLPEQSCIFPYLWR